MTSLYAWRRWKISDALPANWNNVASTASTSLWPVSSTSNLTLISDLVDFDTDLGTGIRLGITVGGSANAGIAGNNNADAPTPPPFVLSASRDLAVALNSSIVTFHLTGLNDSLLYNFSFLSTIDTVNPTNGRNTSFTINEVTQTIDGLNNSTPVTFTDMASTGGAIDIEWRGQQGSANTGILNGFQIVAVPEPKVWLLMLAGLTGLYFWRRRRTVSPNVA